MHCFVWKIVSISGSWFMYRDTHKSSCQQAKILKFAASYTALNVVELIRCMKEYLAQKMLLIVFMCKITEKFMDTLCAMVRNG